MNNKTRFVKCVMLVITIVILGLAISACNEDCSHEYHSEVTTQPSCQDAGIRTYFCALCDHCYSENIPSTGHQFDDGQVSCAPTCGTEGTITYTCTVCGTKKQEPIDKLPHTFGLPFVTVEATCAAEGELSVRCNECFTVEFYETIPKTDEHSMTFWAFSGSTCIETGETADICDICGYRITYTLPTVDHIYAFDGIIVQAGCTTPGTVEYACIYCGVSYQEEIPATGHKWSSPDNADPIVCTVCNADYPCNDGHHYEFEDQGDVLQNFAGKRRYRCKDCGMSKDELYGKHGDYDFDAIIAATNEYAASLGFNVILSTNEDSSIKKYKFDEMFASVERYGGQEYLKTKATEMVDYHYRDISGNGFESSQFTLWVVVSYHESMSIGSGFFHVHIYRVWSVDPE